jgi:hypothetical protein
MALDKDILGQARYDAELAFFNKTSDELITAYGSIENARLAFLKKDSEIIIDHFKNNGQLATSGKGLVAGPNAVTGTSATNIIV